MPTGVGFALVTVRDQPLASGGTAWSRLGRTALMPMSNVDLAALNDRLDGIIPQTQHIPVPLVD
ncbi:MAG TPA: hypothetical protein VF069_02060 [Streptosporangiaceae bacterium]